jgi:chromosome segregation ATPase
MQQQLDNKERYLMELKESYANLQNSTSKQNDQLSEKFSKERKEMNERVEQLTAEISKRERSILSLENIKDGLTQQINNKEQALNELKGDSQKEKLSQIAKIEELKQKYDKSMDELTQSKIDFEREKALKDQKLTFQEQRIKEYHD